MEKQKINVLIIEDNEAVRENLAEILELYGYHTTVAANGLSGAKMAIELLPDIILCDVMMPELDGYGVLNLLSDNERTAGIPFVFITARTEVDDIRHGMNLGADDYITKPFYKDELLQVIRTRLKKAALRRREEPATAHLDVADRGKARLEEAFAVADRERTFDAGAAVVREGEYPHFVYRISEGRVHLSRAHEYGRDYILAELAAGDIFGITSALERSPFHYTARAAAGPARCQLLPTEQLMTLINADRSISAALMHLLAGQVVHHSEQLVHQAYDSVRRRTALVLCDLDKRHGDEPILLSREELAQMVGSTKESVTRALSDFKRDQLVETEGRRIRITRPEALRSLLV
ncbi:DNA-binding response OmpR family regulator [Lewinella marina]|uniref:Transcriptional regulator n=1 Tax=Neolewinella marina TaxID=438751 RepID=A0A2G0CCE1_9BACT|nr:response regulator [Neolewinella marina]NJB87687.1 DNA-binding response OmpR family regulator [Neolewinella marina]PHK97631.1 transcriptional regulator [Neolewinella marina]